MLGFQYTSGDQANPALIQISADNTKTEKVFCFTLDLFGFFHV
jgi:hypothetical protein